MLSGGFCGAVGNANFSSSLHKLKKNSIKIHTVTAVYFHSEADLVVPVFGLKPDISRGERDWCLIKLR